MARRTHRTIGFTLPEGVILPKFGGAKTFGPDLQGNVVIKTHNDGATEMVLDWVCRELNIPYSID